MNALILHLREKVLKLPRLKIVITCLVAVLITLGILTLIMTSSQSGELKSFTVNTTQQLNQIDTTLQHLTVQTAKTQEVTPILDTIQQQLEAMQGQLKTLNTNSTGQPLQALVTADNQKLSAQLNAIQQQLQAVKKQPARSKKLSSSALPFKVLSVDVWNGTPEATIRFNHATDLMSEGDARLGWQLIRLSFDPGLAVFKNTQGQTVNITLH